MNYNKYLKGEVFSGINIVPFTDIVLVLLIIFMIAAPGLLNTGLDIRLPGSKTATSYGKDKISVGMDSAGKIYLNGRDLKKEELKAEIASLLKDPEKTGVILNADGKSPHGKVVEVLDLIKSTGARKIFVGVVPQ